MAPDELLGLVVAHVGTAALGGRTRRCPKARKRVLLADGILRAKKAVLSSALMESSWA